MTDTELTLTQLRRLRRDGFLRLPGAVHPGQVAAARRELFQRMGELRNTAGRVAAGRRRDMLIEPLARMGRSGGSPAIMALYNESRVRPLVDSAFGVPAQEVRGAQLATLFPAEDDDAANEAGYLNSETPHYGWCGHLDGLWNGGIRPPRVGTAFTPSQARSWARRDGTNGAARYHPEFNANMASFSALVGVALSDQRAVGSGNLGVLRGGHRHVEAFLRWQRDQGGPLGPEGPGWPREDAEAPNGHGLVHYPPRVRDAYRRRSVTTSDGVVWPEPTLFRLKPGDAVLVHYATPHGATRVLLDEPRLMVYFRVVSSLRPAANQLVYPDALCANWLEWPAMNALDG